MTLYLRRADGWRVDDCGCCHAQPGDVVLIARNVRHEFHLDRVPVIAWAEDGEASIPMALLADCHPDCCGDTLDFIGWALAKSDGMVSVFTYDRDRYSGRFASIYGEWVFTTEAKWTERMKKNHAWYVSGRRSRAARNRGFVLLAIPPDDRN
jgi:hypothetical protein